MDQTRQDLLFGRKKGGRDRQETEVNQTRIRYTKQHNKIRKIIAKHWHILQIVPLLSPFVSEESQITYRRTRSLKDHLVKSEYTGEFRRDLCKRKGTFRGGGCNYCQYMHTGSNIRLPIGQKYKP